MCETHSPLLHPSKRGREYALPLLCIGCGSQNSKPLGRIGSCSHFLLLELEGFPVCVWEESLPDTLQSKSDTCAFYVIKVFIQTFHTSQSNCLHIIAKKLRYGAHGYEQQEIGKI
jgi:hypothetical protein